MGRSLKASRQTKQHGRGYRKHKSGSKGGRGGLKTHKQSLYFNLKRYDLRRATNIRDLESKLDRYVKKGLVKFKDEAYIFKCGVFCKLYKKCLGIGEASGKYLFCRHVSLSKSAYNKTQK